MTIETEDLQNIEDVLRASREAAKAKQSPEARVLGDHLEYLNARTSELFSRLMHETEPEELRRLVQRDLMILTEIRRTVLAACMRYMMNTVSPFEGIERCGGFVARSWAYKERPDGAFEFYFTPSGTSGPESTWSTLDSVTVLLRGEQADALRRFIDGSRSGAV